MSHGLFSFDDDPSADDYRRQNQAAWDRLAAQQVPLARPARDEDFADPLKTVDAAGWLGPSIRGWKVLCLAAGGGRQGPLYAAAGAEVTVVDISPIMLRQDREVAAARQLPLRTVQASMDHLPMLEDGHFDAVIHPVSTCYIANILAVYREVARVLRGGGVYISQHKTPQNLQASLTQQRGGYLMRHAYYRQAPIPAAEEQTWAARRLREEGAVEFLHRWEEIVGGLCRSGFVIEDLVEPLHAEQDAEPNDFSHRAQFIAPYVRIKARRQQSATSSKRLLL